MGETLVTATTKLARFSTEGDHFIYQSSSSNNYNNTNYNCAKLIVQPALLEEEALAYLVSSANLRRNEYESRHVDRIQ